MPPPHKNNDTPRADMNNLPKYLPWLGDCPVSLEVRLLPDTLHSKRCGMQDVTCHMQTWNQIIILLYLNVLFCSVKSVSNKPATELKALLLKAVALGDKDSNFKVTCITFVIISPIVSLQCRMQTRKRAVAAALWVIHFLPLCFCS